MVVTSVSPKRKRRGVDELSVQATCWVAIGVAKRMGHEGLVHSLSPALGLLTSTIAVQTEACIMNVVLYSLEVISQMRFPTPHKIDRE